MIDLDEKTISVRRTLHHNRCPLCRKNEIDTNCELFGCWKNNESRFGVRLCIVCWDKIQMACVGDQTHNESVWNILNVFKPKRNGLPKGIRHEVLKRDNFKCSECGKPKTDEPLEVDHILPISKGGTDEMSNLRALCKTCNREKSDLIHGD